MAYYFPGVYVEKKTQAYMPGIDTRCVTGFVGVAEQGVVDKPILIRSFDEYVKQFGLFDGGGNLPYAVANYFQNGGRECMVIRVAHKETLANAEFNILDDKGNIKLTAKTPGSWGNNIKLSSWRDGDNHFSISIQKGDKVENFLHMSYKPKDERYFLNVINGTSNLITAQCEGVIKTIDSRLFQDFTGGQDGVEGITPQDFIGYYNSFNDYSGLMSFMHFDEVKLLSAPDLDLLGEDYTGIMAVQFAMVMQAEMNGNKMALLDVPGNYIPYFAIRWAEVFDTPFAALYYPNVNISLPQSMGGGSKTIPCSPGIAGLIAGLDVNKGIFYPPAGHVLKGVEGMSQQLTKGEMEYLFAHKINFLKNVKGQGIKVWGCRTLSSDPEWNMINVRRTFSAICKYLKEETRWAVFEPNDNQLRKKLVRYITSFLLDLWNKGYLHGGSPDQAFYVICDDSNNPPQNVDLGILTMEIGVSLTRPFEFFRISFAVDKNGSNALALN